MVIMLSRRYLKSFNTCLISLYQPILTVGFVRLQTNSETYTDMYITHIPGLEYICILNGKKYITGHPVPHKLIQIIYMLDLFSLGNRQAIQV